MGIFLKIIITLLIVAALFFIKTLIKLRANKKLADMAAADMKISKIENPGTVKNLKIMPLVDFYAVDERFMTEAGVSYLIEADETKILLDVGGNFKKEHPSPLLKNMKTAGVSLESLDYIFLSHLHLDHIGGMKNQKKKRFGLSAGRTELPGIKVFSPEPVEPSPDNPAPEVVVIQDPVKIKEGIISIGVIPRALYIMGYTLENSLAFNLEGKGIVLVIGCGHQSIEKIIERAERLFDEPIYGIIGGLHLPSGEGRMVAGPIDIQSVVGTDRPPWKALNRSDTEKAIRDIYPHNPEFIALSPHDSSDWSINRFKEAFGSKYHDIKVGQPLIL